MSVLRPSINDTNLVPAFGRHYNTAQEVLVGFTKGHPFRIKAPHSHRWHGTVVSIRDLAPNESVSLLYQHNEKKAVFTLTDKG